MLTHEMREPLPRQDVARLAEFRGGEGLFLWDRIAYPPDGRPVADVHVWEAAGATWVLTSIEPQPPEREIREVIQAGP